jgi:cation:H+ antiporter
MNFDIYILLIASLVLMIFMFTLALRKLDRWEAVLMLLSYLIYTVVLIQNDTAN